MAGQRATVLAAAKTVANGARTRIRSTVRISGSGRRSLLYTGVASSIVEERPPIRRIPTDDEPDEDGVIPTGYSAALLALDVGDYPLDHRNAALVFRVADAAEAVGLVGRKPARQSFLFRGENIEDEMPSALERGVHVVLLVDRYEDERRIERDRRDRARGHTDRLAIRLARRQHRHAGRKAPQQLAELR